ncbi:hypothetical protein B0H15DRAFT_905798 [Mycena belliarum]|uniref:F-box domain-containing protein n=1 Tax=Mycena belliarum TaxID=1033014 RepID=A0AAD6XP18_9AGAR|nr:hypothetical protein B0H15DRAFT_905798 [Mycena belliae]
MPPSEPSDSLALLSVADTSQLPSVATDAVAVILRIPPEITAKIFRHCLPDKPSPPAIDIAPLLLGRICKEWRRVAWGLPELWSSLKIDKYVPLELVEAWLFRAGVTPLSIVIISDYSGEGWDITPYIAILQRHAPRWRDITFKRLACELMPQFFEAELHLPMLERLTISTIHEDDYSLGYCHAFRNARALRHLDITSASLDVAGPITIPWAQLTSFECSTFPLLPEHLLAILYHTPNLVKCKVIIDYRGESERLPDVPPLRFLTALGFSAFQSDADAMDVLLHLSLPALRSLDLSNIVSSGRKLVPHVQSFLYKQGCQLRELAIRIRGDNPREEDFLQLLETQPTLERFNLCEGSVDLHLAIFRRLHDDPSFLPRLVDLVGSPHLWPPEVITTTFPVMLETLADALAARWVAPQEFTQIRTCALSWSVNGSLTDLDKVIAEFRPRHEELMALGISIYVGR